MGLEQFEEGVVELVQFVQRRSEEVGALFPRAWGAPRALALRLLAEARPSLEAKIAEFQVRARAGGRRRGSGALSTWPTARQARGRRKPASCALCRVPQPSAPASGLSWARSGPLRLQRPSGRPPLPPHARRAAPQGERRTLQHYDFTKMRGSARGAPPPSY